MVKEVIPTALCWADYGSDLVRGPQNWNPIIQSIGFQFRFQAMSDSSLAIYEADPCDSTFKLGGLDYRFKFFSLNINIKKII